MRSCHKANKLPQGQQQPVRQAQAPKAIDTSRMSTTKDESMNLNQRVSAVSSTAGQQQRAANGQPIPPQGPPPKQEPVKAEVKVGRNDPCPCGSGKKYKACHGAGE